MEFKRKCMVCGEQMAVHSCMMCGSLVCNGCYDKSKKLCVNCSGGKI